jgi:hypothetical protein
MTGSLTLSEYSGDGDTVRLSCAKCGSLGSISKTGLMHDACMVRCADLVLPSDLIRSRRTQGKGHSPADPDPATGRPPPTASAAAYAHAACAAYPPASATAATAASAPSCAAAPTCAPSYCAPACASAPGCCAASAPAATSATGCKSYALAEVGIVFLVEDIKRPQADVGDFLLVKSNDRTQ